jgi:SAM-dependent methyltransferase
LEKRERPLDEEDLMGLSQKGVAEEFDHYRETYSATVNDALIVPGMDVDYFTRVKAEILLDLVGRLSGDSTSVDVLDIGCGIGNYHALLKNQFRRLAGIDVSHASISKAREIHPEIDYQTYDGTTLPYSDSSFDIAYAICVVHHVPVLGWPNFFAEMNRVLKPGGNALIFEHNPYNPLTMRVVNRCPFDADAVLVKPWEARELLRNAGFFGVRTRSFLSIPRLGHLLTKTDNLFGFLPFGAQYLAIGNKRQ